ncbi:MAG TPA: LamG-like jellyroll fold domain-containing protein, partial [Blastocatellia bacterium]|nr:LamG-like jellyroll fold domain-containing protein [Blastocatellia bacterium]
NLTGSIGGTPQWEHLSLSSAESFLSANPVLSDQPLLYLATQDYPFRLPFNHPLAQIRRLLAHFDTTLAEIYAAYLVSKVKDGSEASIAREALELSPEKYNLLTTAITEAPALQQAYGLVSEDAALSDLSNADLFLRQTGLSDDELNELFFQNLRRKRALEFTGSLQVSIGNPPALQALTGDLTIEMWLRPADFNERRNPICKAYGGEFAVTQEVATTGPSYLSFYYGETGESLSSGSAGSLFQTFHIEPAFLNLYQWGHVAIVRDFSDTKTIYVYVNGQLQASTPTKYAVAVAGVLPVVIGDGYEYGYMGQMADMRLWNTARSQQEIEADMNLRLKGDEAGLAGCWPLDDGIGLTARDLSKNENFGTIEISSGNKTPAWPFADNLVWDDNEINAEILSQFFINQGLDSGQYLSLAKVNDVRTIVVVDPAAGTVTPLANNAAFDATLDRLNRFIRLAQSLGWSFADLDLALRSINPPPNTAIDEEAIKALATIKELKAKLGLETDVICALWSDMNTFGIGNGAAAEDLFDRTFNYPTSFADPTGLAGTPPYRPSYDLNPLYYDTVLAWIPNNREDAQANGTRARMRGALGLDDDGLSQINDFILDTHPQKANDEASEAIVAIQLDVPNLSAYFRYSTLARALNLPVSQFLFLLRLLQITNIDSLEKVVKIVDWAEWMQATGLNVAQIEYLTTGIPNRWIDTGYDPSAVPSLIESMFQESQSLLITPGSFTTSRISQQDAANIFDQLITDKAIDQNGVVLKVPVEQALGPQPLTRRILEFDGKSTYISVADDPFITASGDAVKQFTICAWVNPAVIENSPYMEICGMKENNDENDIKPAIYIQGKTGNLALWVGGLDNNDNPSHFSQFLGNVFPAAKAWVHLAWVFDIETAVSKLYRNGELFATRQIKLKEIYTSATGYLIGAMTAGSQLWQGEIANFGIWQRPLDQREIISVMYATELPKDNIGLTACWLINDNSTTIKDSAGTNNGTLNGTAVWDTARDVLGQGGNSNLLDLFIRETLIAALARQDFYVTQKLAAFFNASPALMAAVQALALASHGEPLLHINRLLIDTSLSNTVPDDVMELFAALAL